MKTINHEQINKRLYRLGIGNETSLLNFFCLILLMGLISSFSFAAEIIEPLSCMYDHPTNGKVVTQLCVQFERKLPDWCAITPSKAYKKLCVFRSGSWQQVTMKCKDGKPTISQSQECNRGVTMIRSVDDAKLVGPTIGVCTYDNGTKKYPSTSCTYGTAAIAPLDSLKAYSDPAAPGGPKAPYMCYRNMSTVRAEPSKGIRCSHDPTDANFCDLISLPANFKKFSGKWWVQYTAKQQKKPVICRGGVEMLAVQELITNYETTNFASEQEWYVTGSGTTISDLGTVTSASNVPTFYKLAVDSATNQYHEIVTGCYVKKPSSASVNSSADLELRECNSGGCRADDFCADTDNDGSNTGNINCFRDYVRGSKTDINGNLLTSCYILGEPQKFSKNGQAETNACFRDNGKWYITNKRVKTFPDSFFQNGDELKGEFIISATAGAVSACNVIRVKKPNSQ